MDVLTEQFQNGEKQETANNYKDSCCCNKTSNTFHTPSAKQRDALKPSRRSSSPSWSHFHSQSWSETSTKRLHSHIEDRGKKQQQQQQENNESEDEQEASEFEQKKTRRASSGANRKTVPIVKSGKRIASSYTVITFFVHLIIVGQHIYTLSTTPSTSVSSLRLTSFTQLVYITTTCFHIATLLANVFRQRQLERAFVLYGTWVIWSGWAMCLCLINPSNKPDALLSNTYLTSINNDHLHLNDNIHHNNNIDPMNSPKTAIAPFLMHGNWHSTTLPIISFLLILVIRRDHWGLITWEHLAVLEFTKSLIWYRVWCILGAGAGWMLTWEAAKFWFHVHFSFIDYGGTLVFYRTDLPTFPGLLSTLCTSLLSGTLMAAWWSFWTFQYRGVVWVRELVEGVVVWSSDGQMRAGGVY